MPPETVAGDQREPYLQVRAIRKTFGHFTALRNVSLAIEPGEFVCFLGPSGCGKTTLLRIIAGLDQPDSGSVQQAGRDITRLPPSRRDFGIVFQSYALFPNLTAARNIAFGLQNSRRPRREIEQRVDELLALVGLNELGHRYPAQLSGGQQQRVALARALALSPGLLLLDEPLSALDARVRVTLRGQIMALHRRLGVTTIMVTHDQEEALSMADRVVVMDRGTVTQVGTPEELYTRPANPFVAGFVGSMNFLSGVVIGQGMVRCGELTLPLGSNSPPGTKVTVAVRPEEVQLSTGSPRDDGIAVELSQVEFLGAFYRLTMSVPPAGIDGPRSLVADVSVGEFRRLQLDRPQRLQAMLPPEALRVYPAAPLDAA